MAMHQLPDPYECAPLRLLSGRIIVSCPADMETALMLTCILDDAQEEGIVVDNPYVGLRAGDWMLWN